MKASEFIFEEDEKFYETAKMVWGVGKHDPRGGQTKLKFRCTTGPRKSRQVSSPAKCHDHPNVAQAQKMKTTRARTAPTQSRRQQRTKSINTASQLASKLNKGTTGTPKPWY
jgi:DNA uptake protein ComE-like DNA-binding protein